MLKFEPGFYYYQYLTSLEYPIYLKFSSNDLSGAARTALERMGFGSLSEEKVNQLDDIFAKNPKARLLNIVEANPQVASQLSTPYKEDHFGLESIVAKNGYRVYRFKGHGLMVYSKNSQFWQLGVHNDFGLEENINVFRIIMNRFLSFTFLSMGVLGFWGVPVEEGAVVMNQADAEGEVFFIDIHNNKFITIDGVNAFKNGFKFLRLDSTLQDQIIPMKAEELYSFLHHHCAYFDYDSNGKDVKELISKLLAVCVGLIYPRDNFKGRSGLSLS